MFLRDQPYGVVIEPLIRGSVDAVRQHCPAKRLTPMGLVAGEIVRKWSDFKRKIGTFIGAVGWNGVFVEEVARKWCDFRRKVDVCIGVAVCNAVFVSNIMRYFCRFHRRNRVFGMYLGRKCGCLWRNLCKDYMILSGKSAISRNEFI